MKAPRGKGHAVSITPGTMLEVFAVVAGAWLLWLLRDVVAMLFVALLVAAVLDPFVHIVEEKGVPRSVGMLMLYALIAAAVFGVSFLLLPPLMAQAGAIGKGLSSIVAMGKEWLGASQVLFTSYGISPERLDIWVSAVQQSVLSSIEHIFSTLTNLLSHIVSAIVVFVLAYYIVVEEDAVRGVLHCLTPRRWRAYAVSLTRRVQVRLGEWVRAQVILMIIIGATTFVGLAVLGVPYALLLAVMAGCLELIPYAGPTLSAIPIVLLAATVSPLTAALALGLCVIIQQVENNVFVPKVMQYSVGLSPIVSMVALLVGFILGGVIGALLAIPAATALMVFLEDMFTRES
jgi:predicted PurR-regulated permease PerM